MAGSAELEVPPHWLRDINMKSYSRVGSIVIIIELKKITCDLSAHLLTDTERISKVLLCAYFLTTLERAPQLPTLLFSFRCT